MAIDYSARVDDNSPALATAAISATRVASGALASSVTNGALELTVEERLRLENFILKKRLKQRELQDLEAAETALHAEIMARLGIDGSYVFDLAKGVVFKPNL
jgi:hypothetical protein